MGRGGERPLPLRPLSFGEVIDGAFTLLVREWRPIVIVAGIFLVPLHLLSALVQRNVWGGRSMLDMFTDPAVLQAAARSGGSLAQDAGAGLAAIAGILVLPFVTGAVATIVADSYLGRPTAAGPALRATGRRWLALLGGWLLVHLLEVLPFVVAGAVIAAAAITGSAALIVAGVLAVLGAVAGALVLMALFVAVTPAIVLEHRGPLGAVRRSVGLLRPRLGGVLGIAVVSGLLAGVVSGILGGLLSFAGVFFGGLGWILVAAGGIVSGLVATPFVAVVATLVYVDGRIRREGFDLEIMADELGEEPR